MDNRLKTLYPDSTRLDVLINREEELLLLLDSRHAKFEKQNLSLLSQRSLITKLKRLRPADVVRLIRSLNVNLYSTDIKSINKVEDGYEITIHPHCLMHYGSFKINLFR